MKNPNNRKLFRSILATGLCSLFWCSAVLILTPAIALVPTYAQQSKFHAWCRRPCHRFRSEIGGRQLGWTGELSR